MATKKRSVESATPPPARLFERELAGEEAPSLELMRQLCARAGEVFAREPWTRLSDSELIAFEDPVSRQMCFCCVMGALGQVFSLHVFIGWEGYRVLEGMASGDPAMISSIYALARGVYVELVERPELTPPDREMLRSVGLAVKPGERAPLFRALRPGFHPWYPSEPECQLLLGCLGAFSLFLDHMAANPKAQFWLAEDSYPQVVPGAAQGEYKIGTVKAPQRPPAVLELPTVDAKRVATILKSGLPVKGVLEIDCFHSMGTVGKRHERKACIGVAMAIDAKTAFAFPPEISGDGKPVVGLLPEVLLNAIETSRAIPAEVHVRERDQKHLLDRLARELGFRLKATESLPAFDFAKEQLLGMINGAR